MDDFMNLICPNSPSVWDGSRLSKCFGNIYPLEFVPTVLGFGANAVTIVMIAVLGINQRTGKRSRRINFLEKFFFLFLPAIGACISFLDIALLLKKAHHGFFIAHHEWFFRCSQFASWTLIILFSKCFNGCYIFCNRILCFWWIVKLLLGILHLLTAYPSFQVLLCVKEICTVSLDIIFGISINIIRIKQASYKRSSLEDSLLSAETDVEEGCLNESGDIQSYFDLMTFRSITSVMNHGVTKQLDFEDLLQLPTDMDPCSCHDTLLSCWQSKQSSCPDPSLFRAICCAYGWPYIRLGLLKVLNDCVGFAAPLLLNKLIRFLQQGFAEFDGFLFIDCVLWKMIYSIIDAITFNGGPQSCPILNSIPQFAHSHSLPHKVEARFPKPHTTKSVQKKSAHLSGITHTVPTSLHKSPQRLKEKGQCRKRWSALSSPSLHNTHQFGDKYIKGLFLWTRSEVLTFPSTTNHTKTLTLGGDLAFHTFEKGKKVAALPLLPLGLPPRGRPKYIIGQSPTTHPQPLARLLTREGLSPNPTREHLDLLIFMPEIRQNKSSKSNKLNHLLKTSITKVNKNGDNGSPCLIPLVAENLPLGRPLIMTEKLTECKQPLIHLLHLPPKPFLSKTSSTILHSTRTFDTTLYKLVTKLIGLKSLSLAESFFLGIRQIKVSLVIALIIPEKNKVNPSAPGDLSFPQSKTALRTSNSSKGLSTQAALTELIGHQFRPSTPHHFRWSKSCYHCNLYASRVQSTYIYVLTSPPSNLSFDDLSVFFVVDEKRYSIKELKIEIQNLVNLIKEYKTIFHLMTFLPSDILSNGRALLDFDIQLSSSSWHFCSESWDGYVLAISLGLISIFKSFLDTQYSFHLSRLKLKLRSSIITVIYQKCLYINLAERSKFTEGEIQTFMAIDSDRTVNLCNSFHDMWSLPLQIGVALFLLYTQVKFAFVAGIAITISLIPVNKWISTLIASATVKMMKQKDERIRRTGELLTYIRTLKMHGWELLFSSWLMETRSLEVMHLTTRKYLDAWCVFFWATTPTLFSLFTFGLFTLMGHQLDAATVFTCLALFNTLISPLNSFPWVINGLIDAIISIKRLSRFLSCSQPKSKLETTAGSSSPYFSNDKSEIFHEDKAVVFDDSCCAWSSSDEKDLDLVLKHVTLGIPKGSFVAVIGEVGSGKSSLLNSILGEMRLVHGSVYSCGSIAYVPQVPWILSGTIRDNILFGKHYDPKRYSDTLEASALDLDISLMVGGDMAYIGEKGINLSGGQRARIALARAMYNGSDMFILDDVLSAVDAQVARGILYNAILGPLMKQQTRVLCTHNVQAISSADTIVVMDKGHVKWVGRSADCPVSSYSTFSPLNEIDICLNNESQECSAVKDIHVESQQNLVLEKDTVPASDRTQEIIEVEARKEGRVELTIYKNYATFSGWFISVVICLSAILMQASRNGNDLWLSNWVDATRSSRKEYSTSFYLVILCIFCIVNSILTLVRAFSFAFGGLRAAVKVHDTLLKRLINAPVQFFDQTPGGRILNRFSSDLYTIDDSLPFILNILLANFVGLLGIAIVLSYVQVFFLLLLLPFWYIYSKLQFFYRSTSRELRRLDSVSRSPIYTSFTETLDGSSTIRAFKSEDLFFARFTDHVKLYQQTSYTELTASLWLSLRLQLLAAFIISFVAVLAVIGSHGSLPINFSTPGLVGLALSYAAPVVSLLGSFLTSFTETEKEMVSVERALEYMDVPQEELHGSQSLHPSWPHQGQIEFQNVTLRYKPSLPAALRDINFTIEGGMQVGFIGRTGAGKSSVLNALFRLTPICKGCILVDSINIASAPIRDLRGHFSVVPQTPFLFEGSLRDNLDPFLLSDDLKIWKALERCHVKEEVEAAGGLDIHLKESGMSFSVGQRQLLCLARALLKSSKVLCLDECTANVDTQTASIIQKTISSECRGMTVITIAHRISTVLNMDSVLVLDHGILVEQGNPQALLENESSRFSSFAKASTM
ncbi:unnamed protein product [Prunus brigantina]